MGRGSGFDTGVVSGKCCCAFVKEGRRRRGVTSRLGAAFHYMHLTAYASCYILCTCRR